MGMLTDPPDLDLGSGVVAWWTRWAPDRSLNPQWAHLADVDPCGLILEHPDARDPTRRCESGLTFDLAGMAEVFPGPRWQVVSLEPLTLSPSILCSPDKGGCGLHGFIRGGRWESV